MSRNKLVGLIAALLALTALTAACGGGGSSSSTTETSSGGEEATTTTGEEGEAQPAAMGPTSKAPSINVKPAKIGVLDLIRQSPIDNNSDATLEAAGKALGWEVKVVDAAGDPEKITKGAETLIAEGVDGFISVSVEGPSIRPAMTSAKSKGIPTCSSQGGEEPADIYDAQFGEDEHKTGVMSAEYFNQLEPGSKVIALKSTTIFAGKARLEGFKEALEGEIPFEREINLEDPVGETTKAVQDALVSNPDATGVWPEYDSFTQSAAAAVQREGKDLPVLGYFASPENVKSMTSGGLIKAIVETNISKGATMCLDQFLKHFEKGTPINKNALKEAGGLEYEVITAEEIGEHLYPGLSESANVDHVNPPGAILKPFLASWAKEYPAK